MHVLSAAQELIHASDGGQISSRILDWANLDFHRYTKKNQEEEILVLRLGEK